MPDLPRIHPSCIDNIQFLNVDTLLTRTKVNMILIMTWQKSDNVDMHGEYLQDNECDHLVEVYVA